MMQEQVKRKLLSLDLDGGTYLGRLSIFLSDAANGFRRNGAFFFGPFRRILFYMVFE